MKILVSLKVSGRVRRLQVSRTTTDGTTRIEWTQRQWEETRFHLFWGHWNHGLNVHFQASRSKTSVASNFKSLRGSSGEGIECKLGCRWWEWCFTLFYYVLRWSEMEVCWPKLRCQRTRCFSWYFLIWNHPAWRVSEVDKPLLSGTEELRHHVAFLLGLMMFMIYEFSRLVWSEPKGQGSVVALNSRICRCLFVTWGA